MIEMLEQAGELDNTLIIVTSDNGMPFPRAKANAYEYGIHMPLAIRWGARVPGPRVGRRSGRLGGSDGDDPRGRGRQTPRRVSAGRPQLSRHPRVAAAGPRRRLAHAGTSARASGILPRATKTGPIRSAPCARRSISTSAISSPTAGPPGIRKSWRRTERWARCTAPITTSTPRPRSRFWWRSATTREISRFFHLAVDKRPAEELFDIQKDPGCLHNLAAQAEYEEVRARAQRAARKIPHRDRRSPHARQRRHLGDLQALLAHPEVPAPTD